MTDVKNTIANLKDIPTEEELNTLLRENVVEVDFNKLDGDKRIMKCTKSFKIIPIENQPKSDREPKKGNITVWDINAKGWRSFRYERINSVNVADVV